MKKVLYAKQLYNESYTNDVYFDVLVDDSEYTNGFFIYGNSDYYGINSDIIKTILNKICNYSIYELETYYKNNLTFYVIDALKPYKKISLKNAIKLAKLLKDDKTSSSDVLCFTLQVLFNKRYEKTTIRGDTRGEWQYLFYAIDEIDKNYIDYIEAVYFNSGYEIMIHVGDNIPMGADEIEGFCDYVANIYNIKDYLKQAYKVDDVVFYSIKDIKTITTYKINYEVL